VLCGCDRRVTTDDDAPANSLLAMGRTAPEPRGRDVADFLLWHHADPRFVWGYFAAGTLLARRDTFRSIGPFDQALRAGADWDFAIRAGLDEVHFIAVDEALVTERRHETSPDRYHVLATNRALQAKHRDYLRSRGVYPASLAVARARFHHAEKERLRSYWYLGLASIASPFVILPSELRRTNRRHSMNMPALAQNAGFLFALRAVQMLLRLLVLRVVVTTLDHTQFGHYQFILSCLAMLMIFALPGLNYSVMQSAARGYFGDFRRAVKRALAGSTIASVVLFGLGIYFRELRSAFFLAALLFPVAYGLDQWKSLRIGTEDFRGYMKIEGTLSLLIAITTVLAVHYRPGDLLVPLASLLAMQTVVNVAVTVSALRRIPDHAPSERGTIGYGTRMTVYSALDIVAREIDKILVALFLSPAVLALYAAAERIPGVVKGVMQDIAGLLAPRFAKRTRYTATLDSVLRAFGWVVGAVEVAFAFTLLPWVIVLIFGESYRESIPYAQALMCSIAIGNTATLRYRYIGSTIDSASPRVITIWLSATRIAVSLVLIPWLGLVGAVVGAFVYRIAFALATDRMIKLRYLGDPGIADS
jgi:O-antigen/teichoic acid export membrane protein